MCFFYEKETGRRLRTSIRRDGLWYLDKEVAMFIAAIDEGPEAEAEAMLQQYRLGHLSFSASKEGENVDGVAVGMIPCPISLPSSDGDDVSKNGSQRELIVYRMRQKQPQQLV